MAGIPAAFFALHLPWFALAIGIPVAAVGFILRNGRGLVRLDSSTRMIFSQWGLGKRVLVSSSLAWEDFRSVELARVPPGKPCCRLSLVAKDLRLILQSRIENVTQAREEAQRVAEFMNIPWHETP